MSEFCGICAPLCKVIRLLCLGGSPLEHGMRTALIVCALGFPPALYAQTAPAASIAGRSVSVAQIAGESQPSAESLTTKAVILQPGQSVQEVLKQSGVQPNSAALSVVYSLNPALYTLTDASEYKVVIPAIKAFDASNSKPVTLEVDSDLKRSITQNGNKLASFSSTETVVKQEAFAPVVDVLKETSVGVAVHPASNLFLRQVERESGLLTQYARKANLTDADRTAIGEIDSDLRAKTKALQGDTGDPDIVVRTLAAKDQHEVPLLTICYVPVFLDQGQCDAEFERPSSPTDHKLPVANYHVWAQDSRGVKVSNVKRVEVRDATTVVLVVTQ
jgi:hypothetical protein